MSSTVERNLGTLKVLTKLPKKARDTVLKKADKELILALCEVVHNVLSGAVKLTPAQIRKLQRYHQTLFDVTLKTTPLRTKKRLIIQEGGFLATLLPPALAVLSLLLK